MQMRRMCNTNNCTYILYGILIALRYILGSYLRNVQTLFFSNFMDILDKIVAISLIHNLRSGAVLQTKASFHHLYVF